MTKHNIGVLGATSLVGHALLPILAKHDVKVAAFSRRPSKNINDSCFDTNLSWYQLGQSVNDISLPQGITDWICLAPIWMSADYFRMMKTLGVKRIVALSSTSIFSKENSTDSYEAATVNNLVAGENELIEWAEKEGVEWIILRPTLIYGGGQDKNISEITSFIKRYGFFPLSGKAAGYRQPVHVRDVAMACYMAIGHPTVVNIAYNISGGEILTYREMVERIFIALGKKPIIISLPLPILKFGLWVIRIFPKYRNYSSEMLIRMNKDLVFKHESATDDFGYKPGKFKLDVGDLPK